MTCILLACFLPLLPSQHSGFTEAHLARNWERPAANSWEGTESGQQKYELEKKIPVRPSDEHTLKAVPYRNCVIINIAVLSN